MLQALLIAMALCQTATPNGPKVPQAPGRSQIAAPSSSSTLATFIPVCRDGRGAWDRRACRHVKRNDPARLTLA